jgi:hypothetical protein
VEAGFNGQASMGVVASILQKLIVPRIIAVTHSAALSAVEGCTGWDSLALNNAMLR